MYQQPHQFHPQMMLMHPGQPQSMMNPTAMPVQVPQRHQLQHIDHPDINDVMCGRGGGTNNHVGNIRFRQLVNGHKLRYLAATKNEKPMVSREVVMIWRNLNPPGRFLKQQHSEDGKSGLWDDVGDKKAREKASQCLRERTADVGPFMKKLELQVKLQEHESKKTGITPDNGDGTTAAQLSKELLQEQEEATIKAHLALEAYLPASIINAHESNQKQNTMGMMNTNFPNNNNMGLHVPNNNNMSIPNNNNMGIPNNINMGLPNNINMGLPNNNNMGMLHSRHPLQPPQRVQRKAIAGMSSMNPVDTSLTEQREKLAQEIAQLQAQQAQLEAMARQSRQQPARRSPTTQSPEGEKDVSLPTGSDLLHDFEPLYHEPSFGANRKKIGSSLSKEKYKQSVLDFMGTTKSAKSLKSGSGRSTKTSTSTKLSMKKINETNNSSASNNSGGHPYLDLVLATKGSYDRDSDHNSWIKGLNNFDDVSMSSSTIMSPGNSIKQLLQNEDLEPVAFHDSRDSTIHVTNGKKKEKSLSSFESAILDSLATPTNIGQSVALPNIYEDQNKYDDFNVPQRKPSRLPSQRSNISMMSSNVSSRPTLYDNKSHSNVSMLSECTDGSKKDSYSLKYSKFGRAKSDTSMGISDNLSDLSEALGSIEMR